MKGMKLKFGGTESLVPEVADRWPLYVSIRHVC